MITSRKEVKENIKKCEAAGTYNEHVDPIDYDNAWPVDENFPYLHRPFKIKWQYFFDNLFIVRPFTNKINKKVFMVKVKGKENLKGIQNAILTCNHVDKFDCLVVKKNVRPHRLYITAGHFNNQKGRFGDYMRAGGLMPFGQNLKAMKNFNEAMEVLLNTNHYVLFYPEQAMWWHYEKPRPLKNGAFHYAVKLGKPIIPLFITFTKTGRLDEEQEDIPQLTLHILKPIYLQKQLTKDENIEYLKELNEKMWKETYESFYKRKLTFEK